MDAPPSTRLPEPIPPTDQSGHWRYERRHGFVPEEGRRDLPRTGRTTLYRVEWGRAGLDACVMLTRWEHRHVDGWRREEVVDHAWVSIDDAEAIGNARLRLGALGERLEEEADDARLAGRLQPLPVPAESRVRWLPRRRPGPWHRGFRLTKPGAPDPAAWTAPIAEGLVAAAAVGFASFCVIGRFVALGAPAPLLGATLVPAIVAYRHTAAATRRRPAALEAKRAARAGLTVEEYSAAEHRLERLSHELDAGEELVEDLAHDPR